MSYDAITWALAQHVGKSSSKSVLVAMAHCVNDADARRDGEMCCYPSHSHIADCTELDIKTVEKSVQRLRESGFIVPTGERKGRGAIVYRLNTERRSTPESGGGQGAATAPVSGPSTQPTTPKNGAAGAGASTPVFPVSAPVFPDDHPQFSLDAPPKTGDKQGTEQRRNKEGTRKKHSSFDPSTFPLPEWLNRADWTRWCQDRKTRNKPVTEHAAPLQIKALGEYRAAGHSPASVIDHSIASGYQGLYPPKGTRPGAIPQRRSGFRDIAYDTEGVTDGIPDA